MNSFTTMRQLLESLRRDQFFKFRRRENDHIVLANGGGTFDICVETKRSRKTYRGLCLDEAIELMGEDVPPKLIETEIGIEKYCTDCREYWPRDEFFFLWKWMPSAATGEKYKQYVHICRDCYDKRYKRKRTNQRRILSEHEKKAA